jgi:hypothetical protein
LPRISMAPALCFVRHAELDVSLAPAAALCGAVPALHCTAVYQKRTGNFLAVLCCPPFIHPTQRWVMGERETMKRKKKGKAEKTRLLLSPVRAIPFPGAAPPPSHEFAKRRR